MSILQNVMVNRPKRNNFDLSHEVKMSGKGGYLYPCFNMEVIPGDTFSVSTEVFIRFAPMIAPVMHRMDCKIDFFFTPYRLLWNEWEDFITGGDDGTELPSFPRFQLTSTFISNVGQKGHLSDYLGFPVGVSNDSEYISALPFRAYQKIYNEFYRDQNVIDEVTEYNSSGIQGALIPQCSLRKRAWEKDYFTSCLPWPQKGTEVEIPLNITESSITYKNPAIANRPDVPETTSGALTARVSDGGIETPTGPFELQNIESIDATEVTINELRRATKLQRWLERAARTGSRYIEQIYSHFGVRSSDARLQRPEYLGGGKVPVQISEVLATAQSSEATTPEIAVGEMAGHGVSAGYGIGFKRSFEEHGIILGILTVIPRTNYYQGINKFWQKFDKFDYFWPDFANLGEQEVYQKELYHSGSGNDTIFGYQQRYAEYKYKDSTVHGDFRDTLNFWHQARQFTSAPTLSQTFLESEIDDRIFAVQDGTDYLWMQLYHKVNALRPIPLFSIPELG